MPEENIEGKPARGGGGPSLITLLLIALGAVAIIMTFTQKQPPETPPLEAQEEPPTETMVPP